MANIRSQLKNERGNFFSPHEIWTLVSYYQCATQSPLYSYITLLQCSKPQQSVMSNLYVVKSSSSQPKILRLNATRKAQFKHERFPVLLHHLFMLIICLLSKIENKENIGQIVGSGWSCDLNSILTKKEHYCPQ